MAILEQAIELEMKAESNYRNAATHTKDPGAKRILALLADEEAKHAKVLRGMRSAGDLEAENLVEAAQQWVRGVVEGGAETLSAESELLDVLRHAMAIEQQTESFYKEQGQVSTDEDVRALFSSLAGIERTHYLLVSSFVEYFDRPNAWVENAEFGVRDEY